jgi:glutamate dehydrogenase
VAERDADVAAVVRAFRVAVEVTAANPLWEAVEQLEGVDRASVIELLGGVDALVEAVARWYLIWAPGADLEESIAAGREGFQRLEAVLGDLGTEERRQARGELAARLEGEGVPAAVARSHALRAELAHAPDVIAVAAATERAIEDVARLFFALGTELRIDWMERELGRARSATRMQRWAAQALREDGSEARRSLAIRAFTDSPGAEPVVAVERFLHDNAGAVRRLDTLMRALSREGEPDLAGLTLAVRQLRALVG